MKFLKNLRLASKLSLGFGAILVLLICTVLFGYFGLTSISQNFAHFREISVHDTHAGRVQANLLESRIAFKNFLQSGDSTQKKVFEERFLKMEGFIDELKDSINGADRKKKIDYISEYANEYKDCFEKVYTLRDKRNDINNTILNVKGPELEKNLSSLIDASYNKKYEELYNGTSRALQSLLIARLYVERYLESNEPQDKEKGKAALAELDQW